MDEGEQVGGYRIDGLIADGGMGAVYRATHAILPRRAAIKVLRELLIERQQASERLLREARILELIGCPEIVRVYDAGLLADGRAWMAMELLEGETLAGYLWRRGTLGVAEAATILSSIARVLGIAHRRGIVHRDIKGENVILSGTGEDFQVKVIDWGIARAAMQAHYTQVDQTIGTPEYMAPEQLRGYDLDGAADVYSLGILAYELITGGLPFIGETTMDIAVQQLSRIPSLLRAVAPETPPALEALVAAMLAKEAASRPSIARVHSELAQLAARDDGEPEVSIVIELTVDEWEPAPIRSMRA